jgi:hypothetical protein
VPCAKVRGARQVSSGFSFSGGKPLAYDNPLETITIGDYHRKMDYHWSLSLYIHWKSLEYVGISNPR